MDTVRLPVLSGLLSRAGVEVREPRVAREFRTLDLFEERLGDLSSFDVESQIHGLESWIRDKTGFEKMISAMAELECAIKFARSGWRVELLPQATGNSDLRVVGHGEDVDVEVTRITQELIPLTTGLDFDGSPAFDYSVELGPDIPWPNHVGSKVVDGKRVNSNRANLKRVFEPSAQKAVRSYLIQLACESEETVLLDVYADRQWNAVVNKTGARDQHFPSSSRGEGPLGLMLRLKLERNLGRDSGLVYRTGVTGVFRDSWEGVDEIAKKLAKKVSQRRKLSASIETRPFCVALWNEDCRLDERYFGSAVEEYLRSDIGAMQDAVVNPFGVDPISRTPSSRPF